MNTCENVLPVYWKKDGITKSQNGSARKGSLEVIWFNTACQAGTPRAGCTGPYLGALLISLRRETPQSPCTTCNGAQTSSQKRRVSSMFRQTLLCFNLCPLPLVLSLGIIEKSLVPPLHPLFGCLYT